MKARCAKTRAVSRAVLHEVPVDPEEETTAVAALEANAQIAPEGEPLKPGQTNQMVRQPDGTLVPVRRRFSSL